MINTISIDNISFGYKLGIPIFENLSFTIQRPLHKGYVIGLLGDSGCGKTTFFKLLLKTEKVWSGEIRVYPDNPVISYVPQEPVLFEHLTPMENAMFFAKTKRFGKSFNESRFSEMVDSLDMGNLLNNAKSVNEISGGQKQRIALLRALSIDPDILLLDEPLTGLDEKMKESFLTTILQLANKYHLLIIYITHHRKEVELIADEIIYLIKDERFGSVREVCQKWTSDFFRTPPTISSLYMTKKNETNILAVEIDSMQNINLIESPTGKSIGSEYSISIPIEAIYFDEKDGWPYSQCAETNCYLILLLTGYKSKLVIPVDMRRKMNGKGYIALNGIVDLYYNGNYSKKINIKRNKIVQ